MNLITIIERDIAIGQQLLRRAPIVTRSQETATVRFGGRSQTADRRHATKLRPDQTE